MRNFSRSISLFFSLRRTSENARTRAISKTRDKISFLIQKKAKILFKEQVSLFRSKIQKNSKRIFFTTDRREKTTKKLIRRRRSPLGRNSTHHFVVLIYYSPLSLKIKCSRLREEGLPLRNEEDIEAFSEVVLSTTLKKKQTTTF